MSFVLFFMALWCSDTTHFTSTTSSYHSEYTDLSFTHSPHKDDHPLIVLDDITTEDNFGSQMNAILLDFPNQFVNVKSLPWSDSDTFPLPRYHSHIRLGNAVYMYIQEQQPSSHATYQANFPGSTVPDYAVQSYGQLKSGFMYYVFSCGTFTPGEEVVDGNKRSTLYHINMAEDKSNMDYQRMVVEIGVEQGQTIVGAENTSTVWVPFVRVYGK